MPDPFTELALVAAIPWEWAGRNFALLSIVSTLIVLIVLPALILAKYVRLILPLVKETQPPLSKGPLDFPRLRGEEVDFCTFDGLTLRGLILTGQHNGHPKGMVLFAHEFRSDRQSCARYCHPLLAAGYDVFSIDFRGHGESSGQEGYEPRQWVTDRELLDFEAALAWISVWLEERGRSPEVGAFGISRGAATAIVVAVTHPRVRALACDGVFSTDALLEHLMKRWAYIFAKVRFVYANHPPAFWKFLRWAVFKVAGRQLRCTFPSVRKALMRMPPRPILFVHGERDSYISVDHVRDLYALAGQPKELWIVPKARHNQAVMASPDQYAHRTVAFFDRYLAGEEPIEDVPMVDTVVAGASRPFRVSPAGALVPEPLPPVHHDADAAVSDDHP